jgi:hypothetical protein
MVASRRLSAASGTPSLLDPQQEWWAAAESLFGKVSL